jgi:2-methylcitrate dehydratase PrpD
MTSTAETLGTWAYDLAPSAADYELADRALRDTVAVILAARRHPIVPMTAFMGDGPRWAVAGHILDFDDLHVPTTTHVSVVCASAVLASGGEARAYLAGAGVMARLGTALGWAHYAAGWHATCTAGAPAAAVAACVACGLGPEQIAAAIALSVPGAGGIQRAFGTDSKALQVGFAVDAGIRAARLAADGARADLSVPDDWLRLVGGDPAALDLSGQAVPGGLSIKLYPCCYALQRPISALVGLAPEVPCPADITRIVLRTPASTVAPLIHHRPTTGLEARFSLEYAAATALLDTEHGLTSFSDAAVRRDAARRLVELVELDLEPGGNGLLAGTFHAEVHTGDGAVHSASQQFPPGSTKRPATSEELRAKYQECAGTLATEESGWTWQQAAAVLRQQLPAKLPAGTGE